mgnify:CR=1 FL=1
MTEQAEAAAPPPLEALAPTPVPAEPGGSLLEELLALARIPPRDERHELVCHADHLAFPVRDGIPVMLLDDATPGPQGIGADVQE